MGEDETLSPSLVKFLHTTGTLPPRELIEPYVLRYIEGDNTEGIVSMVDSLFEIDLIDRLQNTRSILLSIISKQGCYISKSLELSKTLGIKLSWEEISPIVLKNFSECYSPMVLLQTLAKYQYPIKWTDFKDPISRYLKRNMRNHLYEVFSICHNYGWDELYE